LTESGDGENEILVESQEAEAAPEEGGEAEGEAKEFASADELTRFDKGGGAKGEAAGKFNRQFLLKTLCVAFAIVVLGGVLFNTAKGSRKKKEEAERDSAARAEPAAFLRSQRDRAMTGRTEDEEDREGGEGEEAGMPPGAVSIPAVYTGDGPAREFVPSRGNENGAPPPPQSRGGGSSGSGGGGDPLAAAKYSSLTPRSIAGSLFGGGQQTAQAAPRGANSYAEMYPYQEGNAAGSAAEEYLRQIRAAQAAGGYPGYANPYAEADPYALQNAQDNKQRFYGAGSAGSGGLFLADNTLWIGTVIPGVLITGINTDLPGEVIARVTQNVWDSRTGKKLLIPQGSLLAAKYNSSISYAQKRVQIVWDALIRPDGFYLELEGMNGVDRRGMSGQAAEYHGNWFEYLKAAGLITMFSLANSKMNEEVDKYAGTDAAASTAESGAEFVNEVGGGIVGRAMNIQPTLTVESGTLINIMLNKNISLPPVR